MYCTIYGYGFYLNEDEVSDETIRNFVLNHRKSFGKTDEEMQILDGFENITNAEELEDFMSDIDTSYMDKNSEDCGLGAMVASIMSREIGIKFQFWGPEEDFGTSPAIVWRATYPWMLNDREKLLTEEELYDICRRYMEELGLDDDPEELDLTYYN